MRIQIFSEEKNAKDTKTARPGRPECIVVAENPLVPFGDIRAHHSHTRSQERRMSLQNECGRSQKVCFLYDMCQKGETRSNFLDFHPVPLM